MSEAINQVESSTDAIEVGTTNVVDKTESTEPIAVKEEQSDTVTGQVEGEKSLSSSSSSISSSSSATSTSSSVVSTSNAAVPACASASAVPAAVVVQKDEFENLQKAVCILGKAKTLDEIKKYDEALKLYRQGVDMLLEELIVRQGTDQSRNYLRGKCNDFMNRIDQLKLIIQIENANNANKENQSQITNA